MTAFQLNLPDTGLRLIPGRMLSVDFETYSEADIKKTGAWRYAVDPTTEVLLFSWTPDEGKTVSRWEYGDPPPVEFFEYVRQGYVVRAWNSEFERAIWERVCVPMLGWDPIPFEQWFDTMAMSYTHALPGKLETAAKALGVEHQKDASGTRLINKFSKPRKPTKKDLRTRVKPADEPEAFSDFGFYCDQDVRTECSVFAHFPRPQFRVGEDRTWRTTILTNERGIRLDQPAFEAVQRMIDWHTENKLARLREITDGEIQTPGQRDKAMAWLERHGCKMEGYTKDDIAKALSFDDLDPFAREFLEIRSELGQVSTKKYVAMANVVWNGRTHNNMVYHRASTGRNGGAGLQLHNFPRDAISKDEDITQLCIDYLIRGEFEEAMTIFGDPFTIAKGLLRSMIIPDEGEAFYCADFSSVENVVTFWLAQDPVGLDVFNRDVDLYREFAAARFNIAPEEVSDVIRTESKATILGSIFGAGWKTLFATNQQKGIPMTQKEAKAAVKDFRDTYHVTASFWYELKDAIIAAVENPGELIKLNGLKFQVWDNYLWIKLHNNRYLAYYQPRNEWVRAPWKEDIWQTTAMGLNSKGAWCRQSLTPARIIENITQATARDLLMFSQDNIDQAGFKVLLNVHDEVLCSQSSDYMPLERFVEIMAVTPTWTDRLRQPLPLKAEGWLGYRYRK